ncbi:zinc-binding dehydrogenase [Dactylosporangium sucinum]|nr:zinc-binding dehydrogenase [Dactylosporangium sucinum]
MHQGFHVERDEPEADGERVRVRVTATAVNPVDSAVLADLLARLASGALRTRIADRLPLAGASEAHARAEAGGFRGKLMLLP